MIDHEEKKLRLIDWGLAEFYHPGKEYVLALHCFALLFVLLLAVSHLQYSLTSLGPCAAAPAFLGCGYTTLYHRHTAASVVHTVVVYYWPGS